jgi:hypothetical protein
MKTLFGIVLAVSVLAMVGAPVVFAQTGPPTDFDLPTTGIPTTGTGLLERVALIGNWVFAIFLAISIIYIVLAAFQFVTGGGDPAQVTAARQKLIYAAVGIAIALLAAGFDDILRNILVAS